MDILTLKKKLHAQSMGLVSTSDIECQLQQAYFDFYQLKLSNVEHAFGVIDCKSHIIACHQYTQPNAKGTFFVLHGYYDHVGLMRNVLLFLIEQGYDVISYDLPGHGLSSGAPATIESFTVYTEVFQSVLSYFKNKITKNWSVLGQSTGCAILIDYFISQTSAIKDLTHCIFFAPLVRPHAWGWHRIQLHVLKHFITQLPRVFKKNSRDVEFLKKVKNDPLSPLILPIQWVLALNDWIIKINKISHKSTVSPIIVQGSADKVIDIQYNLKMIKKIFSSPRIFMLADANHHLINEIQSARDEYNQWLARLL